MSWHPVHELQTGQWAELNPSTCPCGGSGWLSSDWDTQHECRVHGGTPHPEDDEAYETFDYDAHYRKIYRQAFAAFRDSYAAIMERRGEPTNPKEFNELCEAAKKGDAPADWVNAAEGLARDADSELREAEARVQGYSCDLERRLEAEAVRERRENGRF